MKMNYKCFQLITDIMKRVIVFLCVYMLLISPLYTTTGKMSDVYTFLILLPALLICFLINRVVHKLYINIILQIILVASYMMYSLLHPLVYSILFAIFLIPMVIISFYFSKNEHPVKAEEINPIVYLLPTINYIYCIAVKFDELITYLILLSFIVILLILINRYLLHYSRFFYLNKDINDIPYEQIRSSSHLFFVLFLILSATSMLMFRLLPLKQLFAFLGDGFLFILRTIIRFFSRDKALPPALAPSPDNIILSKPDDMTPPNKLYLLFESIIIHVLTIGCIIVGICLIGYLLYRFYKYFYKKNIDVRDTVSSISPFVKRSKIDKNEHEEKPRQAFVIRHLFPSNEEKIRRIFSKVISERLNEIPKELTPSELMTHHDPLHRLLEEKQNTPLTKEEITLIRLYEKARYSNLSCTKEEVQLAKKCLKS